MEFKIKEYYHNLNEELFEWYGLQGFDVLNEIFDVDLFKIKDPDKLQEKLDELRDEWDGYSTDEKIEIYESFLHKICK